MAASFMIRTGLPNAAAKLNPTHPDPRFGGSDWGPASPTRPGIPSDTASKAQSAVISSTAATMSCGVMPGPVGWRRGSDRPDASTLTRDPPTSIARIEAGGRSGPGAGGVGSAVTARRDPRRPRRRFGPDGGSDGWGVIGPPAGGPRFALP